MWWLTAISAIALVLAPTAAQAAAPGSGLALGRLALVTVSNPRPELVSGGEVLVRVDVPNHINAADVQITSDGQDVTSSFQVQSDGSLLGLVTGLAIGRNRLVASAHGQFASSLDVASVRLPDDLLRSRRVESARVLRADSSLVRVQEHIRRLRAAG